LKLPQGSAAGWGGRLSAWGHRPLDEAAFAKHPRGTSHHQPHQRHEASMSGTEVLFREEVVCFVKNNLGQDRPVY